MDSTSTTGAATPATPGLVLARRRITAARARDAQPSDGSGGGSSRSDLNDD